MSKKDQKINVPASTKIQKFRSALLKDPAVAICGERVYRGTLNARFPCRNGDIDRHSMLSILTQLKYAAFTL